jgi:hypothetical protein
VELILATKDASFAAKEYIGLPENKTAVLAFIEDKNALKAFKKKVKSEDETYIALAKVASSAQKTKREYLISTSPDYSDAWATYAAYWKSKRQISLVIRRINSY